MTLSILEKPMRNWFCSSSPTERILLFAQMVDVVGGADAVAQAAQIVDGRKDVVLDDVLWNQVICAVLNHLAQVLVGAAAVQNLAQHAEAYLLVDADFFQFILGVAGNIVQQVHHAVGDDLDNAVTAFEENGVHACALDLLCFLHGSALRPALPSLRRCGC